MDPSSSNNATKNNVDKGSLRFFVGFLVPANCYEWKCYEWTPPYTDFKIFNEKRKYSWVSAKMENPKGMVELPLIALDELVKLPLIALDELGLINC
jgi:hypothetical protein